MGVSAKKTTYLQTSIFGWLAVVCKCVVFVTGFHLSLCGGVEKTK